MVANDVSIPKECSDNISEFLKRNWPSAVCFLVYNGIYNGKNLQKPKIFILGTNNLINLRFKNFAITMELHCNGKNHKHQINQSCLDQTVLFFVKQTGLVWSSSLCGWHRSSYKWVLVNHDSALDMVASEGRALHFSYALFLCTFLEHGK